MELGKEIHRLRNNLGITQEALAEALNVTAQTVSKWERGTSLPDVQMLPEIAVYFGVTIDQLFTMAPEQQMERIENRIYSEGLFGEAEERQMEQQLNAFAEMPEHTGQARLLLTKLYNHQAEQYRLLAVECGKEAVEKTGGDRDAVSELANAWNSYIPDWNVRNHHALIEATLSQKDKTILDLRMKGRTLQEIADIVDYETPSAVKKRIDRIADQYEAFINPLPEGAERSKPEKRQP